MKNDRLVTISIIIAGIIISGTLLYSRDFSFGSDNEETRDEEEITGISPLRDNEPLLGDPKADILFIEYSDTECPFSSKFAKEREKIMSTYGTEGKVAWIYRTISGSNRTSTIKALSLECVSNSEENHKFWKYLRRIENKELNKDEKGGPSIDELISSAEKEGISAQDLKECVENKTYMEKIERNLQEVLSEEARSTPFTVMILPEKLSSFKQEKINSELQEMPANLVTIPRDPDRIFLNGFLEAEKIEKIIEIALSENKIQ
ncbi:MAG: DsbA family protein [Patescibacteria group bacterium]